MIDSEMVFIDTSPFIYYLQCNDMYYLTMKSFWERYADCNYITSSVTITEYLTYPYCNNDIKMVDAFYSFLDGMDITVKDIDRQIAEKAAKIRAEYKGFKAMDALQLATACQTGCDIFLTNDKQLRQFKDIKCIIMEDLK